jgi:16S rRNA (uracil1498-N3)-methyltransferase
MALPFFYTTEYNSDQKEITLDEDTSRHVVQVLRMKIGENLNLTDGKGNVLTTSIVDEHKKHCSVRIESTSHQPLIGKPVSIGISLVKNNNRFEWFLEKATEIGVHEIIPLVCERTEKQKFRHDRMHSILVSAMLQSQQSWLPILHEPIAYELLFRQEEVAAIQQKFIAHCIEGNKAPIHASAESSGSIILIGPEGDFSQAEVDLALANHFKPVALGETRLRTETAGVVAATLLRLA